MKYRLAVSAPMIGLLLTGAGCSQQDQQQVKQQLHIQHQLSWSADVDDTATVYLQGAKAWVDNVTAKPVENTVTVFKDTLPSSPVTVQLTKTAGRGQVALVQQPTADNNYTVAVRIIDSAPDRDHYGFTLTW
jgi:hypothetical protein